jgi:hypothetical protein
MNPFSPSGLHDPAPRSLVVNGQVRQLGRPVPSDVRELGKHGGDRKSENAKNQGSNNRTLIHRGTTANYTLARLDRSRPDLAKRVRAGELSANAAAIKAVWPKTLPPILTCLDWQLMSRLVQKADAGIKLMTMAPALEAATVPVTSSAA